MFAIIFVLCSDAGNSDRVVIQEMLKTVAQSQQLETNSQRDFKGMFKADPEIVRSEYKRKCSGKHKFHLFSKYVLTSCSVPNIMLPYFWI